MKNKLWLIPLAGGLLAGLAWQEKASGLIILTALVPFFYVFRRSINEKAPVSLVFLRVLPGFILFNLLTISWLRNASVAGALYAISANSFLMSSVFWIAAVIYKRSNPFLGFISLLTFWIILEHLNSRLSFLTPWLNLGNTLGNDILFIQWYDITGVAGGTLWILLCNLAIFFCISRFKEKHHFPFRQLILLILLIIIPSGFSFLKAKAPDHSDGESEFLIVQPDIDPYSEKFSAYPFELQLQKMINMAGNNITPETDWVIFPETAIDDPFYEKDVYVNKYYLMIDSLLGVHKGVNLITGATTMEAGQNNGSESAEGRSFVIYNSAMHVSPEPAVSFYHKSKLVPGIEKRIRALPAFIEKRIIPDLGGTMAGYGTQDERTVFSNPDGLSRPGPVICYESVYGDFITEYIRKEANLIVIITNDGWWENTPGYKQHLMFARIRAIENRREVARAANTGISCFINQKGQIVKQLNWQEEGTMIHSLKLNEEITFYSANGDFISRYVSVFGVFILIITFIAAPLRRLREPQKF